LLTALKQRATKEEPVELDHSFQIPQATGRELSHTPALVFTADGKRMVTATAEHEIIVFDATQRKAQGELKRSLCLNQWRVRRE